MRRKPIRRKKILRPPTDSVRFQNELRTIQARVADLVKSQQSSEERIQDLEIHVNLLTRLLTTLCVEKFGMRIGVLKRIIKRIEKETIRDSQISHLESLYKLPLTKKSDSPQGQSEKDRWDDIS